MSTDLYGQLLRKPPEIKLSLWQKRQVTLLYHFASLEYLKGLKPMVDDLIAWIDGAQHRRQCLRRHLLAVVARPVSAKVAAKG